MADIIKQQLRASALQLCFIIGKERTSKFLQKLAEEIR